MGRAIQRVVDILEFIASGHEGRSHADISRELGIPKSTLTDLLRDLVDRQYLDARKDGTYLIGPGSLVISRAYLRRLDAVSLANDILDDLRDATGEVVVLMVQHDLEVVVVGKADSYRPIVATMIIGDRGPLVSTAGGKAVLAFMSDERIDWVIEETQRRGLTRLPIDKAVLKQELKDVRAGQMAFSRDEWLEGVTGIGLPVLGQDGPICAISFGALTTRMNDARILEIGPILRTAVDKLSARLSGVTTADFKARRR